MKQFAVLVTAAAIVLGGCSGDVTLPGSTASLLSLAVVGGDGQTGTVGQPLADPVVVVVRSSAGAPMGGQKVAFVRAGTDDVFDPDTSLTDSDGHASTQWVLGRAPGAYAAAARIVPDSGAAGVLVPLQAAATAGAPDTVRAVGPLIQPGRRREPLDEPLVVAVVDRFGNPVAGVRVKWKAGHGNGDLAPEESVTAADGTTSVTWTLGNEIGVQRATAEVEEASTSSVTFTATVGF
jgi:hypothetical protein